MPEVSECTAPVIRPYLPLLSATIGNLSAEETLPLVESELINLPEVQAWDGVEDVVVGCKNGGDITVGGDGDVAWMWLEHCELVQGFVVSGRGEWDFHKRSTDLDLTVLGTGSTYNWASNWDDDESASMSEDCGR